MLFSIIYEVFLLVLGFLWLPRALYLRLFKKKYQLSFLERFGIGFPDIERGASPLIWVHAVSLGETKAVVPLMRLIQKRYPKVQFVLSSITETGYHEGKRSVDFPCSHVFLPFDFGFILKPILGRLKPDLVLISETDFWYRFLSLAKCYGAKIVLVNGKVSSRSALRLQKFPFFTKRVFGLIDLFCVQSQEYKERFLSLLVPEEKVAIFGNLKFDQTPHLLSEEEKVKLRDRLHLGANDPVIVVGSTHPKEEEQILHALKNVWEVYPALKVLFVPRHPERFSDVAKLFEKEGMRYSLYSKPSLEPSPVILVDAMGVLMSLYQIASLAIVGGSFRADIGGHNILEPAWFQVPVIFGPYMHNQTELVDLLINHEGGFQMQEFLLGPMVLALLQDPVELKRVGLKGKELTENLAGSSLRTLEAIEKLFNFSLKSWHI